MIGAARPRPAPVSSPRRRGSPHRRRRATQRDRGARVGRSPRRRRCDALEKRVAPAIASWTTARIAVSIAPLATLLPAGAAPRLSSAVAAPSFSSQAPDFGRTTALLLAPALSCDVAGPVFDSRRLHFSLMILPKRSVNGPGWSARVPEVTCVSSAFQKRSPASMTRARFRRARRGSPP